MRRLTISRRALAPGFIETTVADAKTANPEMKTNGALVRSDGTNILLSTKEDFYKQPGRLEREEKNEAGLFLLGYFQERGLLNKKE